MNDEKKKILSIILSAIICVGGISLGYYEGLKYGVKKGIDEGIQSVADKILSEMIFPCNADFDVIEDPTMILLKGYDESKYTVADKIDDSSIKRDDLVYTFKSFNKGEDFYSLTYISKSGDPVDVYTIKDLKKIDAYTGEVTYIDGSTSSVSDANYDIVTVDPISTDELRNSNYDVKTAEYYDSLTRLETFSEGNEYTYALVMPKKNNI